MSSLESSSLVLSSFFCFGDFCIGGRWLLLFCLAFLPDFASRSSFLGFALVGGKADCDLWPLDAGRLP